MVPSPISIVAAAAFKQRERGGSEAREKRREDREETDRREKVREGSE